MSQQFNKRLYSLKDYYKVIRYALKTIKYFRRGKKSGELSSSLESRIMLAVTEVNGCEICSYYHTGEALKNGISEEDISSMLNGNTTDIPLEDSVAILFAQHYADLEGKPNRSAWNRLVSTYGKEKAYIILAATRVIMFGNILGIAYGALKNRLKGQPVAKSNLTYELSIVIGTLILIPGALIHNLFELLVSKSNK